MKNPKRVLLKYLNKTFITSENNQVVAVNNIDLDIQAGEFITMLGPSGCGKTTTLRMIAGFEMPTNGQVFIGDEDVASKSPDKRDTAMVFQNYALFPHMNVYDNIAYGLKIQKRPKQEISERVNRILSMMKMEDFANRVPAQMSGGQQQRVSLARALVMEPGVLLFDEPLSNLDAKLRIHMREEIRRLQKEVGITSIYVTHDQEEAMAISDKVVIMNEGIIEQADTPQEVYQHPVSEFVATFIGRANILDAKVVEVFDNTAKIDIFGVIYEVGIRKAYEVNQMVRIVIRPEGVIINDPKHQVRTDRSIYMGQVHEYTVDLNGVAIDISDSNPMGKRIYQVNEVMHIGFDAQSIHVL